MKLKSIAWFVVLILERTLLYLLWRLRESDLRPQKRWMCRI